MNVMFEGHTDRGTDVWLTPPYIVEALGEFDLDPCSPLDRPWDTAKKHYNILDDGFSKQWEGRVWCNPPYGREAQKWIKKCADHGNAMTLIFARTETKMFFDHIWNEADALFFMRGRVKFYTDKGIQAKSNAGAPSVLVAYGSNNAEILKNCSLNGKYISLK